MAQDERGMRIKRASDAIAPAIQEVDEAMRTAKQCLSPIWVKHLEVKEQKKKCLLSHKGFMDRETFEKAIKAHIYV